jgi:hypothetical protein
LSWPQLEQLVHQRLKTLLEVLAWQLEQQEPKYRPVVLGPLAQPFWQEPCRRLDTRREALLLLVE